MAYEISFENSGRGAVLRFSGDVSGSEVLEAAREMYDADTKLRLRYQIVDLTGASSLDISENQLRRIAFLDKQAASKNPRQIVALVGSNEIFAGSDKNYAIYTEVWAGFSTEFFTSMAEVRDWVAREYPEISPATVAQHCA